MRKQNQQPNRSDETRSKADEAERAEPSTMHGTAAAGRLDAIGPTGILALQRTMGNAAVTHLIQTQPALTTWEAEGPHPADAHQPIQRCPDQPHTAAVQRCPHESHAEEQAAVQRFRASAQGKVEFPAHRGIQRAEDAASVAGQLSPGTADQAPHTPVPSPTLQGTSAVTDRSSAARRTVLQRYDVKSSAQANDNRTKKKKVDDLGEFADLGITTIRVSETGRYILPGDETEGPSTIWERGGQHDPAPNAPAIRHTRQTGRRAMYNGNQYVEMTAEAPFNEAIDNPPDHGLFLRDCLHTAEELMHNSPLTEGQDASHMVGQDANGQQIVRPIGNDGQHFQNANEVAQGRAGGTTNLGNARVLPNVGQAYLIVQEPHPQLPRHPEHISPFHAAAVVAADGNDRITLETFAGAEDAQPHDAVPGVFRIYQGGDAGVTRAGGREGASRRSFWGTWANSDYFTRNAIAVTLDPTGTDHQSDARPRSQAPDTDQPSTSGVSGSNATAVCPEGQRPLEQDEIPPGYAPRKRSVQSPMCVPMEAPVTDTKYRQPGAGIGGQGAYSNGGYSWIGINSATFSYNQYSNTLALDIDTEAQYKWGGPGGAWYSDNKYKEWGGEISIWYGKDRIYKGDLGGQGTGTHYQPRFEGIKFRGWGEYRVDLGIRKIQGYWGNDGAAPTQGFMEKSFTIDVKDQPQSSPNFPAPAGAPHETHDINKDFYSQIGNYSSLTIKSATLGYIPGSETLAFGVDTQAWYENNASVWVRDDGYDKDYWLSVDVWYGGKLIHRQAPDHAFTQTGDRFQPRIEGIPDKGDGEYTVTFTIIKRKGAWASKGAREYTDVQATVTRAFTLKK